MFVWHNVCFTESSSLPHPLVLPMKILFTMLAFETRQSGVVTILINCPFVLSFVEDYVWPVSLMIWAHAYLLFKGLLLVIEHALEPIFIFSN